VLRLVRADSQIPVLRNLRTALALADNRAHERDHELDGGSGPLRAGRDSHGATGGAKRAGWEARRLEPRNSH
jgi:hypothetical protein